MKKLLCLFLFCSIYGYAKINSYVTILPQKYFIQKITQDKISIRVMNSENKLLKDYQPSRKQLNTIEKHIDLYFTIDLEWEKRYKERFKEVKFDLKFIDMVENLPKNSKEFRWIDPLYVKDIATNIYNNMAYLDPKNRSLYLKNYKTFLDELDNLYLNLKFKFKQNRVDNFYVFDDSFKYFLQRFDLKQTKLVLNKPYLTSKQILQMKRYIKQKDIKAILILNDQFIKEAQVVSKALNIKIININIFTYKWMANIYNIAQKITQR